MSCKYNRGYRIREAIRVRSLVLDKDKKKYGVDRACAEPFLKCDLKSKEGKQTTHFQSTDPDERSHHSYDRGMQSVVH